VCARAAVGDALQFLVGEVGHVEHVEVLLQALLLGRRPAEHVHDEHPPTRRKARGTNVMTTIPRWFAHLKSSCASVTCPPRFSRIALRTASSGPPWWRTMGVSPPYEHTTIPFFWQNARSGSAALEMYGWNSTCGCA
jgi:hypothetical protein